VKTGATVLCVIRDQNGFSV